MLTKEIRKGDRFVLNNGWYATMKDHGRGTTRIAEVEGFYTEIGSVYSHDIAAVIKDGKIIPVQLTEKELKLKAFVDSVL